MENVNHPKHYNLQGKKECIEQMLEDYGLEVTITFCLTNAYKYLYRAGEKIDNPLEQDINKARWYYQWAKKHDLSLIEDKNIVKLREYVRKQLDRFHES